MFCLFVAFVCGVLGVELASHMLGKLSTSELHPSSLKYVISKTHVEVKGSHLFVLSLRLEKSHILMNPCSDEYDRRQKIVK